MPSGHSSETDELSEAGALPAEEHDGLPVEGLGFVALEEDAPCLAVGFVFGVDARAVVEEFEHHLTSNATFIPTNNSSENTGAGFSKAMIIRGRRHSDGNRERHSAHRTTTATSATPRIRRNRSTNRVRRFRRQQDSTQRALDKTKAMRVGDAEIESQLSHSNARPQTLATGTTGEIARLESM